jgi:two-component system sensor histidine kinase NreB
MAPDPALQEMLATAKHLVRRGQEEFRRSLLNLRTPETERGSFVAALREFSRTLTEGPGIHFALTERGPLPPLAEAVETNLLRICQECLTNAARHANACNISVDVCEEGGVLGIRIRDDGCGFDPASLDTPETGHFGWRGIRERATQIGARVECASGPGLGTDVLVSLPITAPVPEGTRC